MNDYVSPNKCTRQMYLDKFKEKFTDASNAVKKVKKMRIGRISLEILGMAERTVNNAIHFGCTYHTTDTMRKEFDKLVKWRYDLQDLRDITEEF